MRRLITGTVAYFSELVGTAARGWNSFFFTPADPTALGVIRVALGLLLLWSMGVYGLDLRDYFGSDGWADPAALKFVQSDPRPYTWTFWTRVPDSLLWPAWLACMAVLTMFTLGLWSRVTAVLAWVIVVSTIRRVPVALFGFDQAVSTLALYVAATGASGQAVSLDRYWERWKFARAATVKRIADGRWPLPSGVPTPTVSANLALRLIQLHFCLIYGSAGLAKLQGAPWWNGLAIWGTLASGEFNLFNFTRLASHPYVLNVLTHATLAVEVGYPILIWVRPVRPLVIVAVAMMHLGIGLTAPGLAEFGLAMIAGNLAFVSGAWLRSLVTGRDRSVQTARVLYDGACPRCRASISLLSAADPARLVAPIDLTAVDVKTVAPGLTREACMKSMHAVRSDGKVFAGFDAVLAVGKLLPPFWLPSAVGSLPGVRQVGRLVYQKVADSRPRDAVCTDEACGIHPARGPVSAPKKGVADVKR